MPDSRSFRPTMKDQDVIAALQERHPNLNTLAAVIRYCIHVTNQTELAEAEADLRFPPLTDAEFEKQLARRERAARSRDDAG